MTFEIEKLLKIVIKQQMGYRYFSIDSTFCIQKRVLGPIFEQSRTTHLQPGCAVHSLKESFHTLKMKELVLARV